MSTEGESSSPAGAGRGELWKIWWELVCELRSACARNRTFLWMGVCLAGMTTRKDLTGVTSTVRALGLLPACYDRLLDFFHSPALDLAKLTLAWRTLVFRAQPGLLRINGKPVLAGDGIKVAKSGRKMPAVKKLHQQSESNTKPEYIFGHSCQAVAVLAQALSSVWAIPLACRIHEGVVFSNRDKRTLLDKMILLIDLLGIGMDDVQSVTIPLLPMRSRQPDHIKCDLYYRQVVHLWRVEHRLKGYAEPQSVDQHSSSQMVAQERAVIYEFCWRVGHPHLAVAKQLRISSRQDRSVWIQQVMQIRPVHIYHETSHRPIPTASLGNVYSSQSVHCDTSING